MAQPLAKPLAKLLHAVLRALHPTPAVCGHPTARALDLIRELEGGGQRKGEGEEGGGGASEEGEGGPHCKGPAPRLDRGWYVTLAQTMIPFHTVPTNQQSNNSTNQPTIQPSNQPTHPKQPISQPSQLQTR